MAGKAWNGGLDLQCSVQSRAGVFAFCTVSVLFLVWRAAAALFLAYSGGFPFFVRVVWGRR